jgi:hypothetical protein
LREVASVGDDHNALVMVTVKASFGPGEPTALPGAQLHLIDDNISSTQRQDQIRAGRLLGPRLTNEPALAQTYDL